VSDGTDNHLVLVDLKSSTQAIDGARVERVLELANIATNKNTVPGDKSALTPGGIRMGTPAVTTRGFTEEDCVQIVDFFDRGVTIANNIKSGLESKKLKDFKAALAGGTGDFPELEALANEVAEFSSTFPTIGYSEESMRYPK